MEFFKTISPGDPGGEKLWVLCLAWLMATCRTCGKYFANVRQLGPHRRKCHSSCSSSDENVTLTVSDCVIHRPTNSNARVTNAAPVHVDVRGLACRRGDLGVTSDVAVPQVGTASRLTARDLRAVCIALIPVAKYM